LFDFSTIVGLSILFIAVVHLFMQWWYFVSYSVVRCCDGIVTVVILSWGKLVIRVVTWYHYDGWSPWYWWYLTWPGREDVDGTLRVVELGIWWEVVIFVAGVVVIYDITNCVFATGHFLYTCGHFDGGVPFVAIRFTCYIFLLVIVFFSACLLRAYSHLVVRWSMCYIIYYCCSVSLPFVVRGYYIPFCSRVYIVRYFTW
jgi:hypothetical protein